MAARRRRGVWEQTENAQVTAHIPKPACANSRRAPPPLLINDRRPRRCPLCSWGWSENGSRRAQMKTAANSCRPQLGGRGTMGPDPFLYGGKTSQVMAI